MDKQDTSLQADDFIVFRDTECLYRGHHAEAVRCAGIAVQEKNAGKVLVFHAPTATLLESTGPGQWEKPACVTPPADVPDEARQSARGRPKLGVTAREVTLLPRHWEWLEKHPAGASAKLRDLVEKAMRAAVEPDRRRRAFEVVERFTNAIAGDLPNAEEVSRALYAAKLDEVRQLTECWPKDVQSYYLELAGKTLPASPEKSRA